MPADELAKTKISYSFWLPFDELPTKKYCTLNSDGTFEFKLDYAFPYQKIGISVGRNYYINIYANSNLFIELDAEKIRLNKKDDAVKFSGTDGEMNIYLKNYSLFQKGENSNIGNETTKLKFNRKMKLDEFLQKSDSLFAILENIDKKYITQNPSKYFLAY